MTGTRLDGTKVAFLMTDGFEQVEFTEPWNAVRAAGAEVRVVSPIAGTVLGFHRTEKGDVFDIDVDVAAADASDFDALVLPGGVFAPR